ncbi:MAG: murein hydrolase activator EnvC family protein [Hoeflea sp.]|uniref:murein hydrolase activator EnvC family protein n=1 Tax=Hoeflea sp. TaxID=1940281 RepID=UPI003EF0B687
MWSPKPVPTMSVTATAVIRLGMSGNRMLATSLGLCIVVPLLILADGAHPAHATEIESADTSATVLEQEQRASRLELQSVADEADLAAKALSALESDIAALRADQQELDSKIAETASRRAELDQKIAAGEQSMTGLSERQDSVRLSLISRRSVLAEILAALQRIGRDPPPALLVTPEDALSSVRSAILLGAVVPEIRAETEALAADLKELASLRQAIAAERLSLASALERNAEEEQRLASLASEKTALQEESSRRLERERKRAEALSVRSNELESVITTLADEIVALKQAAEAARKVEQDRQRQLAEQLERARAFAAVAVPDKNRIMPAYAFSKLTGTLLLPTHGETVRYFGADDGAGHTLAGEVLATQKGATVSAPADGWIAYAGPFRSYGQVVIIDTGENHHVVLAGMEKIKVSAGRFVVAGEPLATMGQTRFAGSAALSLASERPTLYIEIRKDGQPVDPRSWWKDDMSSRKANNDT